MADSDSHNDTHTDSYHRDFLANFARGLPPERCAGAEGHDTASIGGLAGLPPVIFATRLVGTDPAAVKTALLTHLRSTHRSQTPEPHALALGELLVCLLRDTPSPMAPLAYEAIPERWDSGTRGVRRTEAEIGAFVARFERISAASD